MLAQAALRLRFADQPPDVLEKLRLANALAEYCIAPPAVRRSPPSGPTLPDQPPPQNGWGGGGAAASSGACGREQFMAALRKQDPLAHVGLELDEPLLDLAWQLLRWQPEERLSAEAALRHPALAPQSRELVRQE